MTILRKKIILSFIFFISVLMSYSQVNIDSLLEVLPKAAPSEKANVYLQLSNGYLNSDLAKSEEFALKALSAAKLTANKVELASIYHELGKIKKLQNELPQSISYFNQSIVLKKELEDYEGLNKSYGNIGDINLYKGNWSEADTAANLMIFYGEKANYTRGLAIANNLKGNIYMRTGRYDLSISYYQKALKLFEDIGYDGGVGVCLNNIALIFQNLSKHKEAKEYFLRALKLHSKLKDDKGIAEAANNVGNFYSSLVDSVRKESNGGYHKQYGDSCIKYYTIANEKFNKIGKIDGQIASLNNLAIVLYYAKNYNQALSNFKKALELLESQDNSYEKIITYHSVALCYKDMGEFKLAKEYTLKAIEIGKKGDLPEVLMNSYKTLSQIHDTLGEYKNALENFKKYANLQDTLRNESSRKVIEELNTQYQTDKKNQEIENQKVLNDKQLEINKKQKNQLIFSFVAAIIVLLFLILMIRQYLEKRKANNLLQLQNEEISQQKEEIETQRDEIYKQKELIEEQQLGIMDSIQYACRIQEAILPQSDVLQDVLGQDHFVLFKPRDIVSGDFYWLGRLGEFKICAAADCTGHGVPGAFMSMLGTAFLNEIVNTGKLTQGVKLTSNEILNQLRELVISSLRQTGKSGEQKDGMDIALYLINEEKTQLDFSGANNPLIIIRPASSDDVEIDQDKYAIQIFTSKEDGLPYQVITLKANKMPIGIYAEHKPFENIIFPIQSGDAVYSFSDGYQDQFGGPKNKKFMIKNLKQLLVDSYSKEMLVQHLILDDAIEHWKTIGETDQVDDILVIGMRV